jgi:hypothetical protein
MVNRCYLCKSDGETVNHLLLHCEVENALWYAIFNRFGLSWVMPNSVADLFACWWAGGHSRNAIMWKMVPLCLMWCLWEERNARCFEDLERSSEELKSFFFFFSFFSFYLDSCTFFLFFLVLFSSTT